MHHLLVGCIMPLIRVAHLIILVRYMDHPTPQLPVNQALMALIFDAAEEALEALRYPMDFTPFVLFHTPEGRILKRFSADSNAEAIEKAHLAIQREPVETRGYALVYDATMTANGKTVDALIIEAGERQGTQGVRFAQRYGRSTEPHLPVYKQGHIAYLGQIALYFA